MKQIVPEQIIGILLDESKKNGSTDTEVILSKKTGKNLSFRNGKDEYLEEFDKFRVGLKTFKNIKNSVISSDKIDEYSLRELAKKSCEITSASPGDKFSFIAKNADLKRDPLKKDLKINTFDDYKPSLSEFRDKANNIEVSALNHSSKLKSDGVQISWSKTKTFYANSNSFFGSHLVSNNSNSIVLISNYDNKMERDYHYSSKIHYADLETPELIAKKASEKVLKKIGSKKPPTGKFPIIFEPRVAKSILRHVASALNGSSIVSKTSFFKDDLDKFVFNKSVNIIDDPHINKGHGSRVFDGEGLGTKKTSLVLDGKLENFLLNLTTAKQLNLSTNCNAVRGLSSSPMPGISNLVLLPGKDDEESFIKEIKEGFYVTELIGSSVSMITGDYSRGASGFWIKNGKISRPISEATIAGNLKNIFMNMFPCSNLEIDSSISAPSIFINEMIVAGGLNVQK